MSEEKPIHAKPSLYAFYFEFIKKIGKKYGYNIVLHGSMNRDLDLVAIAWEEKIKPHEKMIKEIAKLIGGEIMMQNRSVDNIDGDLFGLKPHGRLSYIININRDIKFKHNAFRVEMDDFTDPQYYLDISVIPIK